MTQVKKQYTLGEEIFNSVSHGIGSLLSVAGSVFHYFSILIALTSSN